MSQLNKSQELKPCPFCGSESVELKDIHHVRPCLVTTRINVWIDCHDCPCNMHLDFTDKDKNWREISVEKWNTRDLNVVPAVAKTVKATASTSHLQTRLF
jgi:hypothetical protein